MKYDTIFSHDSANNEMVMYTQNHESYYLDDG